MSEPLKIYEVDVLVQQPTTRRVIAHSESDAREAALRGEGEDISGTEYTFGEAVDVRPAP
jgi:hypothetical protein